MTLRTGPQHPPLPPRQPQRWPRRGSDAGLLGAHSRDEQVAAARALDRTLLWQYYSIPNWYLNSHRLAYRNRFAFVATPPYTLGLRAWWQKNLETSR